MKTKKRKAVRKVRKPRMFRSWWIFDAEQAVVYGQHGVVFYGVDHIRKLGEYLIKVADYLESRK